MSAYDYKRSHMAQDDCTLDQLIASGNYRPMRAFSPDCTVARLSPFCERRKRTAFGFSHSNT